MRVLREWLHRVAGAFSRGRRDEELQQELRLHLQLAAKDAQRRGETPGEAARLAGIRAGGVSHAMDQLRDQRGLPWLDDAARDVRHGLRALRRAPVFASVVVLTLALGIGANTAILSIVDGVLLRPLPYPQPDQLMYLTTEWGSARARPVSVAEYLEFQQFSRSFAHIGAFRTGEANLAVGDRAFRVRSAIVDSHLLNALGRPPAEGRLFTDADSVVIAPALPGGSAVTMPVALISYELWQSSFGARPIIGHSIDVDGRRLQVVGVMARGTDLMDADRDVWLPLGFSDDERRARDNHDLMIIGRLKNGVTAAAARTELAALIETWSARAGVRRGAGHAGHVFFSPTEDAPGHILQMTPLADQILGGAGRSIWVLQAAVAFVLLIACANVANLLLARAETRRREFAVLTALGASRGRLLRKAMAESVILSVAGGALGVLLARAGIDVLIRAYPDSLPRIGEAAVDMRVMLVSFALALVCGVFFGLAPTLHIRSGAAADALKSGARGSSGTSRHRMRRVLVIGETALAVIVVVGAGLLLRTVQNLTTVDAGFDRARLVTFSITLPRTSFKQRDRVRTYQELLDRLRAVPGVRAASAMTSLPLDRGPVLGNQTEITNSTATSESLIPIDYQRVMSGFFETMRIPILQGRSFQPSDVVSDAGVAVVNESMANRYWNGQNAIGQRLRPAATQPWFTVIGVAKDVKQSGVDQAVGAEAYLLVDQLATDSPRTWVAISPTTMHVALRTTTLLETLAPTITQVVRRVDPTVPVARLREMDDVFAESIRRPRLLADLLALFSALALLLATIGIYGVLASLVAERCREIGIRMSLGADRSRVLGQIMKQGLLLTGIGVAAGLVGALGLNQLLSSLLFGVQPTDPTILVAVTATIVLVAAVASGLPAWRASRLDPNVALRDD